MQITADANKVIKKLLDRIAYLEEQNAILLVNLEDLVALNNKMNQIEESVK